MLNDRIPAFGRRGFAQPGSAAIFMTNDQWPIDSSPSELNADPGETFNAGTSRFASTTGSAFRDPKREAPLMRGFVLYCCGVDPRPQERSEHPACEQRQLPRRRAARRRRNQLGIIRRIFTDELLPVQSHHVGRHMRLLALV